MGFITAKIRLALETLQMNLWKQYRRVFAFHSGKSFVGVLNKTYTEMDKVFNLSSGITSHAPLCHWHEILGQPGLLHCVSQSSGNPVLVMVTPEKILVSGVSNGN